jgi:hypothetical protein
MSGISGLEGGPRPPTWSERQRLEQLRAAGIEDVYLEPEKAPKGFWYAALLASDAFLISSQFSPRTAQAALSA